MHLSAAQFRLPADDRPNPQVGYMEEEGFSDVVLEDFFEFIDEDGEKARTTNTPFWFPSAAVLLQYRNTQLLSVESWSAQIFDRLYNSCTAPHEHS